MAEQTETMILCSTGTIVGRANGFDHRVIIENRNAVEADGFELMMLAPWYGRLPEIARELTEAGISFPVIHFEKDVGPLLSLGTAEDRREGLRLFTENAKMGGYVGAEKAVFHLWDGRFTEAQLRETIALTDTLYEICEREGLSLLAENVPCQVQSPHAVIARLAEKHPKAKFTFDTRHASFMKECEKFFADAAFFGERIGHLHFSDYTGQTLPDKWGVTRPILHPREGIIDFERLFAEMPPFLGGTATLESPVLSQDGTLDREKLNRSLRYLAEKLKK